MRLPLVTSTIALTVLQATANAGPVRACAQVSTLIEGAVTPLLAEGAAPSSDTTQLRTQFRACLSSRNICGVVYKAESGRDVLVAGEVTTDLPAPSMAAGRSSVIFLVRSIPRVRNDSNQYCLVSEKWDVYGWVIAPNAGEALPLPRQRLEDKAASDARSPRALAAALWFFAQRMSGQSSPPEKSSEESAGDL